MNSKDGDAGQLGRPYVSEKELAVNSRTLAARIRSPELQCSYIVPVLSKALRILELLAQSERPMNTHQITRITGYSLTTVYRILRTLSAHGYLPEGCDGVYTLKDVFGIACLRSANFFTKESVSRSKRSEELSSATGGVVLTAISRQSPKAPQKRAYPSIHHRNKVSPIERLG